MEDVNRALSKVVPVHTVPGYEKLPYYQNDKTIRQKFRLWISNRFVPDKYEVSENPPRLAAVKSRRLRLFRSTNKNQAGPVTLKAPRYLKRTYEKAFVAVLKAPTFNGVFHNKISDWEILSS